MRTSTVATVALSLALAATNAAWLSKSYSMSGIIERDGYRYRAERAGSKAARNLLPNVLCAGTTRGDLLASILRLDPAAVPREGNGVTWAGPLGFRFDGTGRLTEVQQVSAGIVD